MPTYAYACTTCEHRFEAQQSFTDEALTECPECAGRLRKLFNSVGIVFKGSGFYRTDSRASSSNGSKSSSESPGKGSDSTGESAAKGKSTESGSTSSGSDGSGSKGSGSNGSGSNGSRSNGSGSSAKTKAPAAAGSAA